MRRLLAALAAAALTVGAVAYVSADSSTDAEVAHAVVQPGDGWLSVAGRIAPGLNDQQRYQFAVKLATANGATLTTPLLPGRVLVYVKADVPTPSTTTTVAPTTSSTTLPPTTTTQPRPADGFPTRTSVGVPAGWTPTQTINGTHTVRTAGAVVQDVRINGSLVIAAPNVTVRRVEIVGGAIDNWPGANCQTGLLVEDTTIRDTDFAIGSGDYTARRVLLDNVEEGFRVQGGGDGCGPAVIEDSYAYTIPPVPCGDWHGDALQGYVGAGLTIRNTVLVLIHTEQCLGTAPMFWADGSGPLHVDGLIVSGGGFSFRAGFPSGSINDLYIVEGSFVWGPMDVPTCGNASTWDAQLARLDAAGQPVPIRALDCEG